MGWDGKDPPWFNKRIKFLIQKCTLLLETFQKKLLINTLLTLQGKIIKLWKSCKILIEALKHIGLYSNLISKK